MARLGARLRVPRTWLLTVIPLTLRRVEVAATRQWLTLSRLQTLAPRYRCLSRTSATCRIWETRRTSLSPRTLAIRLRTLTTTRLPPLWLQNRRDISVSRWCRWVQSWVIPEMWWRMTWVLKGWSTQLEVFSLQVWWMTREELLSETTMMGTLLS